MDTIQFFEGSYQFKSVALDPNESTLQQATEGLQSQFNYRPTTETLWAEVRVGQTQLRYKLKNGVVGRYMMNIRH